jgi:uncharacterized membrane protein
MTGLTVDPVGGWWLAAAAALVLAPLLALRPSQDRQSRGRRWALVALRAVTLLLLLGFVLRPALEHRTTRKLPGTLIVLQDASRSMEVADAVLNQPRYTAMRGALDASARQFADLSATWDVHGYTFGRDIATARFADGKFELPAAPEGVQTAIGAALEDVLAREAQQRIVAVVLLSDGAQRAFAPRDVPPQSAVRRLAADGIPLYTFVFGQPALGQQADLRMSDLLAPDAVFADTPMTVEGVVTAAGYANQEFKVQLLWESADGAMEPVDTRTIKITPRKRRFPVQLAYTPRQPGEYKVTLAVESPAGELVTTNNSQTTFVTVLKGGVNILYVAGSDRIGGRSPGPEPFFVTRALAAHADLHVERRVLTYVPMPLDWRDELREQHYDVILLANVDAAGLSPRTWQEIANEVERGAGLAMLGGFHSFGPGGFVGTPLEAVLPLEMNRAERQNFGEPHARDLHLWDPLRVMPVVSPGGAVHPIMKVAEGPANLQAWRDLPPLDGANKFDRLRLKRTAQVVAEGDNPSRSPLLVLSGYGEGRTAAFAGDSTWHWQLEGHGDVMRRFWRQLVLWLAKKDETSGERVWVRLDQRRYQQGSRVDFTFGAEDEQRQAIDDAQFEVRIETPEGKIVAATPAKRGAGAAASFAETATPGDYRITVAARRDGESLGTASARFSVTDQDVELDQPAAEPALLASLAAMTAQAGGTALAPEELPDLLERLKSKAAEFEEEIVETVTLWDKWPPLLAFVGLLSIEWYLRKKWGLV